MPVSAARRPRAGRSPQANPQTGPQSHATAPAAAATAQTTQTLAAHLHFSPEHGRIQLFDQRMLLVHAASLATLRRELLASVGPTQARAMLTRMGWQQGFEDGQRVRRLMQSSDGVDVAAALALGPRLREIEGFVHNQPIQAMQMDVASGRFEGDFFWNGSWEAQAHLTQLGVSGEPACWTMVGYADGYSTAVSGVPVHWREVECVAMGHARCRVIGRPLAEWEAEDAAQAQDAERAEQAERQRPLSRTRQGLDAGGAAGARAGEPAPPAVPHADAHADATGYLRIAPFVATPGRRASGAGGGAEADGALAGFVGASAGFNAVAHRVRQVAPTDSTVLFYGESGVGKECFARALHTISPRAQRPFVAINCAAIPPELVEAELFGVERGAYTGADRGRPGRFERADGGTLLLDEVSSLSLPAQGKLLRALQEREIERVGGTALRRVDVRIVAAANVDLRDEMNAGRFRKDLFYRLNVFPVQIPPLRERPEDIPLLVALFLQRACLRCRKPVRGLSARASAALWDYDWPGNVRELENMIERGVILAERDGLIDLQHLFCGGEQLPAGALALGPQGRLVSAGWPGGEAPAAGGGARRDAPQGLAGGSAAGAAGGPAVTSPHAPALAQAQRLADQLLDALPSFDDIERLVFERAVQRCEGNVSAVARLLRMGRGQVDYRIKKQQAPRG